MFKNKSLHFEDLNLNSILPKLKQLRCLLTNPNISVLGINETKLVSTVKNEKVKVDGYNLIRSDRNRKEGGVLLCEKKTSFTIVEASVKTLKTI